MNKDKTEDKTVVLPLIEPNEQNTTIIRADQYQHVHTKKGKYKKIYILMLCITIVFVLSICGYIIYEYKTKQQLTRDLINAIKQNNISQAQIIISEIKRHNFKSNDIEGLKKRLEYIEKLNRTWKQAEQYYNAGMYKEAKALLTGFTQTSVYRDKALTMLDEIKQKELDSTIKTAMLFYSQGDNVNAIRIINQVIEIDPTNEQAHSLLSMIKQQHINKKKYIYHTNVKIHEEDEGDKAYKQGDFDKALFLWSHSHKANNSNKLIILTNIKRYMNSGENDLKTGEYNRAITSFNKILSFLNLIEIKNKALECRVKNMLSDAYGMLGKKALANSEYSLANKYFQKSIIYNVKNVEASRGLLILNDEAENLYKKAYVISDANMYEACKLYKQALEIAQKDSDVYKKIKEHILACEQ